ncbi:hypothetical protein [Salana multivorans]
MAMAGETVLAAYDLGVSYGSEPVLRGIDLEPARGRGPDRRHRSVRRWEDHARQRVARAREA